MSKDLKVLIGIFILAVFVRFLFFPGNIYFGFDQARDAFISQEILHGHLKLVGPTTSIPGLFHGPLFYYLWAPFYLLGHGNPVFVAAFLRMANALGVFIVFFLGSVLFNKRVGILSSLLFAISFEQTQYSLDFGNPSLSVLTVLLFYLGLALLIFKKDNRGLILASICLGLSIQFEFGLIYLIGSLLILILFFRQIKWDIKTLIFSAVGFLVSIATFIISTLKFHFKTTGLLVSSTSLYSPDKLSRILNNIHSELIRFFQDNIYSFTGVDLVILIYLALFIIFLQKDYRKILFLLVMLFSGIFPYINTSSGSPIYFYAAGASVALILFTAWLIDRLWKYKIVWILMLIIIASNINQIITWNPKGPIPEIDVQVGMLLSDEKKVLAFIYQNANNRPFSVSALTLPYQINTTWAYLFDYYGKKYNYIPPWGEENAFGYPGDLKVEVVRSNLPDLKYVIYEPSRGIPENLTADFTKNENYFTKVVSTKYIGDFRIEIRQRF